jgi:hypothetical protein
VFVVLKAVSSPEPEWLLFSIFQLTFYNLVALCSNTVTMNHEDILNFNLFIVLSSFFFLSLSHLIGMTILFSFEDGGFYGLYFIVFNVWASYEDKCYILGLGNS